mmetsp:Transcript_147110/g.409828  ORF Transcript_147110/g.409828 Transcript_147110/m.409828 type:complete len:333 (-) Transcript_147110:188-1186(-)
MRAPCRSPLALVVHAGALVGVVRALSEDDDYKDDSKACTRWYPKPVQNICHENFPNKTSEKLWIMLFTSHACIHCREVVPGFVELAKELQSDPSVGVGVVNCYWQKNYRSLCSPHLIDALPSVRLIEKGNFGPKNKGRHTWEDINSLVREKLGGRDSCQGVVPDLQGSAVVPLCKRRFPGANEEGAWAVVYFSKSSASHSRLLDAAKEAAQELGNAAMSGAGAEWARMKRRDRLLAIRDTHGLGVSVPEEGPLGYDSLAKVGAVCCDCDAAEVDFCRQMLGSDSDDAVASMSVVAWIEGGELQDAQGIEEAAPALMEYALSQLGFIDAKGEL